MEPNEHHGIGLGNCVGWWRVAWLAIPVLLLALAAASVPVSCDREKEIVAPTSGLVEIVIATGAWPGSAALFVAQEKGYFSDEGLAVSLQGFASGHLGLEAVMAGEAELASVGETPIVSAALNGEPVVIVATICRIDRAILIIAREDSGIASADDLRSKRIGVVPGTTADFFLHIYLTTSYIKPSEVQIVELDVDAVIDALEAGEVDAISTWAPYTALARDSLGDNAVVLEDPGLYRMSWNIIASRELAARAPDSIERVLRAIVRANEFIRQEPDQARAITAAYTWMDIAALEKEWPDYYMTVMLDLSLLLYLEDQAKWMMPRTARAVMLPNFLDHIYSPGLRAVRPEAVRIVEP